MVLGTFRKKIKHLFDVNNYDVKISTKLEHNKNEWIDETYTWVHLEFNKRGCSKIWYYAEYFINDYFIKSRDVYSEDETLDYIYNLCCKWFALKEL